MYDWDFPIFSDNPCKSAPVARFFCILFDAEDWQRHKGDGNEPKDGVYKCTFCTTEINEKDINLMSKEDIKKSMFEKHPNHDMEHAFT